MQGAREFKVFFKRSEQHGRLFIAPGSHARGDTLHVYVLPDGVTEPEGQRYPSSGAVEVYGITGGHPGWTETYGWLQEGPWVQDFEALVEQRKTEKQRIEVEHQAEADKREREENERQRAVLTSYSPPAQQRTDAAESNALLSPDVEQADKLAVQPQEGVTLQLWCDTCEGTGKLYQEHQAGCHVGGDYACPDCDGKGFIETRRYALAAATASHPLTLEPIASAPLDGTPVVGWSEKHGYRITASATYGPSSIGHAQGRRDRWWEWIDGGSALRWSPTHWQPLLQVAGPQGASHG